MHILSTHHSAMRSYHDTIPTSFQPHPPLSIPRPHACSSEHLQHTNHPQRSQSTMTPRLHPTTTLMYILIHNHYILHKNATSHIQSTSTTIQPLNNTQSTLYQTHLHRSPLQRTCTHKHLTTHSQNFVTLTCIINITLKSLYKHHDSALND